MSTAFAKLLATSLAEGAVADVARIIMSPFMRGLQYKVNDKIPNVLPDFVSLIDPYTQGVFPLSRLKEYSRIHGQYLNSDQKEQIPYLWVGNKLDVATNATPSLYSGWDAVRWSRTWHPNLDLLLELRRRGYITQSTYDHWLNRLGVVSGELSPLVSAVGQFMPPVQDLIRFAVREVFNPVQRLALQLDAEYDENPEFKEWAAAQGLTGTRIVNQAGVSFVRDISRDYWAAHWQLPSPTQIFEMLHRLRPGRSGHFAVSGVDPGSVDISFVRAAIKANDYAPVWRDKLASIAYRLPGRIDIRRMLGTGIIDKAECVQLYRDLGYTTDDSDALAELAEKLGPWKPPITKGVKWFVAGKIDLATYNSLLDTYGVPEVYRAALRDTANKDVPTATLTRWLRKGLIDERRFMQGLEDAGYDEADSEVFRREARSVSWTKYTDLARTKILEATRIGAMDDDEARQRLIALGLSAAEANTSLQVIKLENDLDLVKKVIAAIHTGFLRGEANADQARLALSSVGIAAERIDLYLRLWLVEFTAKRKQLSADRVLNALARGLLNQAEAVTVLTNLGYDDTAIRVLMAIGTQDVQEAVALASLYSAQNASMSSQAAVKLLKEQDRIRRTAQADLAKHGSPSQLKKWFNEGLIPRDEVERRLRFLGWPTVDIDRLLSSNGRTSGSTSAGGSPPTP